jgi:Tfp pilus assembly protein PilF
VQLNYRLCSILVAALLFAGCKTTTTTPPPAAATVTPATEQAPQPEEALVIEPVQRASMSDNRAVVALLNQAQAESGAGKHDAASASLERALRIEPRNPWVWEELAQVRLAEGQYDKASSLARKSNSFAGGKRRVQAVNWQVIGKARVAQGDSAGAEQAFKRAQELARQAKDER